MGTGQMIIVPHPLETRKAATEYALVHGTAAASEKYGVPQRTIRTWISPAKEPLGKRIIVIPDVQAKPETDFSFLSHIGQYIAKRKPHIVVVGGDFADMPSLSFHDAPGSKNFEGKRYKADILAAHIAMKTLMEPIQREMAKGWKPRLVMLYGNHEYRIERTIQATPKLDGIIGLPDLEYERWGFEVHPFLQPVIIEDIAFCHYFCSGIMGRPVTTARALISKMHMSCFAFHQQGRDIAYGRRADGREITAIICGSCYEHNEDYLNAQTNTHFRGIYELNDVVGGVFDEMAVSLRYLRRKYGTSI